MVHGDGFAAVGDPKHLESTEAALSEAYKIKTEKEVRILNEAVRIADAGIEMEADPRHPELVVKELGLIGARIQRRGQERSDTVG